MSAPDLVIELANARIQAREMKDFSLADKLRNKIAQAEYEVVDIAEGYELREKAAFITLAFARDINPIDLEKEVSVAMIVDGYTDDALESINLIKQHSDCGIVILSIGDPGRLVEAMDSRTYLFAVQPGASWGDCANVLLQKIQSTYVVLVDPATRFIGDAISPAIDELKKGEFVAVGWRGGLIDTDNEWRCVIDKGVGEVDALHSLYIAFTREAILETGGFNLRAVYFHNADIEMSLKIRQAGGRLLQMDLPLELGRHHAYDDVDPAYRDQQSEKNLNRLLERFKGKSAILSPRR